MRPRCQLNIWKRSALSKFDYTDISATHEIMKRDVGIAHSGMKKENDNKQQLEQFSASVDDTARWFKQHQVESIEV